MSRLNETVRESAALISEEIRAWLGKNSVTSTRLEITQTHVSLEQPACRAVAAPDRRAHQPGNPEFGLAFNMGGKAIANYASVLQPRRSRA
ncbi:hypothetical protein C3F00_003010 [Pseudomonas sp. MWU13-2860]|nr:hypothetical protein C3F00_003010 [Pseudomonas sp. MWU13-2860]